MFCSTHCTRLWCSMIGEMAYLWLSLSFRGHVNKISAQFSKHCITGSKQSTQHGIHPLLSLTMLRLKLIHWGKLSSLRVLHKLLMCSACILLFSALPICSAYITLCSEVVTPILHHLLQLTPSSASWFLQPGVARSQNFLVLVACQEGMGRECSKENFQSCRTHHCSANAWRHNVREGLQC